MHPSLSRIPIERRRRMAATLGLFAVLFIAIAAVAGSGTMSTVLVVFIAIAIVVGLVLALMAWGLAGSVRQELAERRLDAAIEEVVAARGTTLQDLTCGCGHDHDPNALHVPDDPCAHDGAGHECSRTCESCVFSRLARSAPAPSGAVPSGAVASGAVASGAAPSAPARADRPRPGPR